MSADGVDGWLHHSASPLSGDRSSRTPAPKPAAVGLDKPGYLWAVRLTRVGPSMCTTTVDGWTVIAVLIIDQARLGQVDAVRLHAAAERGWAS